MSWRAHSHSSRKIRRSAISCPSGLSWSCRMTSARTSLGEVRTRRRSRRALVRARQRGEPHPPRTSGREGISGLAAGRAVGPAPRSTRGRVEGSAVTLCGAPVFVNVHERPTSTPGRARSRTPPPVDDRLYCLKKRVGVEWRLTLGVLLVSPCLRGRLGDGRRRPRAQGRRQRGSDLR